MPRLTRWMVKTAMLYLVLALATGALLGLRGAAGMDWIPSGLTPAYFHLYMVGWVTLLIFGIVFWMFPKYSQAQPRGSERLGWAVYGLINAGLILRVLGETFAGRAALWNWMLAAAALLLWLGGALFVANTWQRVKER